MLPPLFVPCHSPRSCCRGALLLWLFFPYQPQQLCLQLSLSFATFTPASSHIFLLNCFAEEKEGKGFCQTVSCSCLWQIQACVRRCLRLPSRRFMHPLRCSPRSTQGLTKWQVNHLLVSPHLPWVTGSHWLPPWACWHSLALCLTDSVTCTVRPSGGLPTCPFSASLAPTESTVQKPSDSGERLMWLRAHAYHLLAVGWLNLSNPQFSHL